MAPPTKASFSVNTQDIASGQWDGGYEQFKKLGEGVSPARLRNAAVPWTDAQSLLMTTYEELSTQAYRLVDAWQGDAAAEFQKNLQSLYKTACALADATGQVGIAMGYHASDLDTLVENVQKMKPADQSGWQIAGDIATFSPAKALMTGGKSASWYDGAQDNQNAADDAVKKWMNTDLSHATQTYTYGELPKDVDIETPNPSGAHYKPTADSPGSGTTTPPSPKTTTPHLSPTTPHTTPTTPHTTTPIPTTPHGTTPTPTTPHGTTPTPTIPHGGGTSLAGLGHPGGGGGPGSGGLGGGGLGPSGLGSGLGAPGLGGGAGGLGSGAGGLGSAGGMGSTGGQTGSLAAEEEAAAARNAAAAGRSGANGMPMGAGGGHGEQEQERERTTWLSEDEDVWGGDDDVSPPVIG